MAVCRPFSSPQTPFKEVTTPKTLLFLMCPEFPRRHKKTIYCGHLLRKVSLSPRALWSLGDSHRELTLKLCWPDSHLGIPFRFKAKCPENLGV